MRARLDADGGADQRQPRQRQLAHFLDPGERHRVDIEPVGDGANEIAQDHADQEVDEIAENMADIQIRRLPVLDRDKRLVGILSLSDIATSDEVEQAAEALCGISRPVTIFPQYPAA